MNKLTLSMIGIAALSFVFSMEVQARGAASTHISTGPSPSAAHASGTQGSAAGVAGTVSAPGMASSGARGLSQLLSPTPGSTSSFGGIASSSAPMTSASTMNGSTVNSSLGRQLQARGIVAGVGNSMGSMNAGAAQSMSGNRRVVAMARQMSQPGNTYGGKAARTTAAFTTGKPQGPVVLGLTRAPKTGEVCIWGAGTDGSCH